MPAIPSITDFTGSGITEGEFKAALTGLHAYLVGAIGSAGTQSASLAALGAILGAGSVSKSGTYSVVAADRGKIIECTGTWTLTLPDASAVGNGFAVVVANVGTGNITLDPYASQTLDGQATKIVPTRQTVICTAVSGNWITVSGGGSGVGLLRVTTFTSSGTWIKPADCRAILVEVKGGGGGGSGGTLVSGGGLSDFRSAGRGGGEGRFSIAYTASPAGSYVVTIGAGGAGGLYDPPSGSGNGASGGTSSFGALASATGGLGGRVGGTVSEFGGHGCGAGGGAGNSTSGGSASAGAANSGGGGGGGGIPGTLGGGAGGAGGSGYVRVYEFG